MSTDDSKYLSLIKDEKVRDMYFDLQRKLNQLNHEKEKWRLLHQQSAMELNELKHQYNMLQLEFLVFAVNKYIDK